MDIQKKIKTPESSAKLKVYYDFLESESLPDATWSDPVSSPSLVEVESELGVNTFEVAAS